MTTQAKRTPSEEFIDEAFAMKELAKAQAARIAELETALRALCLSAENVGASPYRQALRDPIEIARAILTKGKA